MVCCLVAIVNAELPPARTPWRYSASCRIAELEYDSKQIYYMQVKIALN